MSVKAKTPVLRSLADLAGSSELKTDIRTAAIKKGVLPKRPVEVRTAAIKSKSKKPELETTKADLAVQPLETRTIQIDLEAENGPDTHVLVGVVPSVKGKIELPAGKLFPHQQVLVDALKSSDGKSFKEPSNDTGKSQVGTVADLGNDLKVANPTMAETVDGEVVVEDKSEEEERQELIVALLAFDTSGRQKELMEVYHQLHTQQLRDMHDLLRAEWGGTGAFKKAVVAVEALINKARTEPLTKKRISLLRQKYKEYHKLAMQVEKALGTDTVIRTLKHTAYHSLLENVIKDYAVLSRGIREMGNMIAFQMSPEAEVTDESQMFDPANTEEMVRVLLVIGTSAKQWMMTAAEASKRARERDGENEKLKKDIKELGASIKFERERYQTREDELKRKAHRRFGSRFALVNGDGMFLATIDPKQAINPANLELVGNIKKAMVLTTEDQVLQVYDKLRAWSREDSKYYKIVKRKGLRPEYMDKVEITLTRI